MIVKRVWEYAVDCPEIGDRIDFTLKTGENIEAMAVQKLRNGTVFCAVDYLSDLYQMNYNGETKGEYEGSDLRKILNSKILDSFPDDIREQLIPFDNGDLITIPSEREMFGKNVFAARYEVGVEQWKPMENRHNRVAFRDGEYEFGWLRNAVVTPYNVNHVPTSFVNCSSLGTVGAYEASSYLGVRPVFIMRNSLRTEENKMIDRKTWEEYRNSGMLWFANVILNAFGWAIVFDTEHKDAYPARVRFRGYSEEINSNGYRKVSKYIAGNANDLLSESEE